MGHLIIIGTGLAGYTLAREYRKISADDEVTLLTLDDGANYSKPMLSNGLAKQKSASDLAVQSASQMAELNKVHVKTDCKVNAIDHTNKNIELSDGSVLTYTNLVLAVGASQIKLPIKGDGAEDAITVNSLVDYAVFRDKLVDCKRVAVMGPGLIGCEFANDLAAIGMRTTVIGPDKWPLERLVPKEAGQAIKAGLDNLGCIDWHLGTTVSQIDRLDNGYKLTLSNDEIVEADLVVSAAGLVANKSLAETAGINTARGILVDRTLKTSVDSIYALGDCIEMSGLILPYVMPIMNQARALAKTLTGEATSVSYPAMPVAVKTPAHPIVVSPPAAGLEGEWEIEAIGDGIKATFINSDKQLLGFVLTGNDAVREKQRLGKTLPPVLE